MIRCSNIWPGIAINVMATFIHNEATCLNVIQEAGLPDAFYHVVESGLEPVIEVRYSFPVCDVAFNPCSRSSKPYRMPLVHCA